MAKLYYSPSEFPKRLGILLQPGQKDLTVSWPEVLRHAITVGRAGWKDVFQHHHYSTYEALYRELVVAANLMENSSGEIVRSPAYLDLDPSEKGAISYFLGLTMVKLASERLFKVRWLMHLDKYKALVPELWRGRSRPDLVGADSSMNWVALEAKGRTRAAGKALLSDAKDQLRNLKKVAGQYPALKVASALHFARGAAELLLVDPYDTDPDAVDLDIPAEQFVRDYYSPVLNILRALPSETVEVGGSVFRTTFPLMSPEGFSVGLDLRVFELLNEEAGERDLLGELRRLLPHATNPLNAPEDGAPPPPAREESREMDPLTSVGLDGVLVRVGEAWRPERMRLLPHERYQ